MADAPSASATPPATPAAAPSVHAIVREQILVAANLYVKDLLALPETELAKDRGARIPYDYTYETALINRRMAARLRRVEPEPIPAMPIVAPELFHARQLAADEIRESAEELARAWDEVGEAGMTAMVPVTDGEESALGLVIFAINHIFYHDGQLTVAQQQAGDHEVHW